jgi:hypothetical protein
MGGRKMEKFEIVISYHKCFEKTKIIRAKSYEAAEERARKIADEMEEREHVVCAEVISVLGEDD